MPRQLLSAQGELKGDLKKPGAGAALATANRRSRAAVASDKSKGFTGPSRYPKDPAFTGERRFANQEASDAKRPVANHAVGAMPRTAPRRTPGTY